ncbi:probable WRKY transcription factor 41 [Zingiber officinale]|uniref:WRKY domain-containing protein n=1 Tax=Zingiber officinale TaxID=94328 RepID=A0A8J5GNG3_ZINOF|nr:probable WRKY transcription factor 41 [Zingiber officinale]KAG6507610.1 hypothetical protein ZIOFF_032960 [Zingiber officinale]
MENGAGVEQGISPLMAELARALRLVQQLDSHLSCPSPAESCKSLAPDILSSIQKSILMAQSSNPGSPASAGGSPRSDSSSPAFRDQERKEMMKKRKTLHKWTRQVKLTPGAAGGVEGPVDDGYSWRKYGQKDILGAKHPRAYYRCTHRKTQGCPATKQVQRSDDDPLLFDITYLGTHSCLQRPQNKEQQQQRKQRPELKVKTEGLDGDASLSFASVSDEMPAEIFSIIGTSSPDFLSPVTSESACLFMSPCPMVTSLDWGNSSVVDMDFLLDELDLEQSFQFDASSFST